MFQVRNKSTENEHPRISQRRIRKGFFQIPSSRSKYKTLTLNFWEITHKLIWFIHLFWLAMMNSRLLFSFLFQCFSLNYWYSLNGAPQQIEAHRHMDTTSSPSHHLTLAIRARNWNINKKMSNENIENQNILNYKYFVLSFLHISLKTEDWSLNNIKIWLKHKRNIQKKIKNKTKKWTFGLNLNKITKFIKKANKIM